MVGPVGSLCGNDIGVRGLLFVIYIDLILNNNEDVIKDDKCLLPLTHSLRKVNTQSLLSPFC